MAYRSDVRIVTTKKGYEELTKYVENYLKDDEERKYNLLNNTDVKLCNEDEVMVGWNSCKWYEYSDFIEVDAIMNGLDNLKSLEHSYRYVRLGEDVDDIDEKYIDGDKDKGLHLSYPQIERYFDDDRFIVLDNKEDLEV